MAWIAAWAGLALVLTSVAWIGARGLGDSRSAAIERLPRRAVRRADLHVSLTAGGMLDSSKKTKIECELENLRVSIRGNAMMAGGASTILEVIADGAEVHRDDVLCRLDSSDYEELVRQQEIKVAQARSDELKAELTLKSVELALVEYREGTLDQQRQDYRGQLQLTAADFLRQRDRVGWAKDMVAIGYQPQGKLSAEEQSLQKLEVTLRTLQGQSRLLEEYGSPVTLMRMEADVQTARSELAYQRMRVGRQEEQLAKLHRQVERCTIRAPHDGVVVYASHQKRNQNQNQVIEPGTQVYQKMDLFYLPDLSQMEVQATLHESIVEKVRPGMAVRVSVEGLPDADLEGHVVQVSALPIPERNRWLGDQVKNYLGRIKLDTIPRGLLPGMTAEVEILTDQRYDALVIPYEALTIEGGRQVCYVAGADGLERREIKLGQATPELLEVAEGLSEGEEVVLEPTKLPEELVPPVEPAPEPAIATADGSLPVAHY